ncbi:hypothetical protein [Maridesulfovibrio sp.]|uniref:hypothetical protein n=1 Tax=Maridesulfovibrio sp. TaxID=2795000 RepID=UPI0029CA2757|nr:hypothetical protein [Maridesulfovibrio sp.]
MIVLKNLAESFITSAIDASATRIVIPADHAEKFPNLLAGDNFRCALVNPATEAVEFINVTARENNVLTVSRGEEGTAPLAFPVESRIHIRMTAKTWEEMAAECWIRPKNVAGDLILPQYESADSFSITGDFSSFFTENRAVKTYPNKSVGFVESAVFADGVTTVKVVEMTVPADLTHVEAGLDPDALAKRSLSNEELLGYMTPIPILEMEALEVDGGTLVSGTIKHPEAGKTYPDSTEFNFNLPDGITDFSLSGQTFQMRMPVITEFESPKTIGPVTCRAAQLSLLLSDPSNAINLAVRYVAIKAGVTLSFADTEAGYPGADVNADGAQLPATTAGLDNPTGKAITGGTAEFEITGGELPLSTDTTEAVVRSTREMKVGDAIVADTGTTTVASVTTELLDSTTIYIATLSSALSEVPSIAVLRNDATAEIGAGAAGEYLGARKVLAIAGTPGTASFDIEGAHSYEICIEGGLHNNLTINGQDEIISSATESTAEGDTSGMAQPFGDESCVATYTFDNTLKSIDELSPEIPADNTTYDSGKFGNGAIVKRDSDNRMDGPVIDFDTGGCLSAWYDGSRSAAMKQHTYFERLSDEAIVGVGVQGYTTTPGGWVQTWNGQTEGQEWLWALQDGQLHHLVYNVEENDVVVYADKVEVFRQARPTGTHKLVRVGTYNNIGYYFDQFRLFNRTLTMDEINVLYDEIGDITTTTVTPETELASIPTSASIPNRCTAPLTIDSCVLSGNALKYTCAKVPFTDPNIKRLSLSFSGDSSLRVKAAKIYTEEGA